VKLAELHVYPLKSARGVSHETVRVDRFGPEGDRRYMLVTPDGRFVTQRRMPKLALLGATLTDGGLDLRVDGRVRSVRTPDSDAQRLGVQVWGDTVPAAVADDETSAWLSDFLETEVRLVHMPEDVRRPVDPDYAGADDTVGFADGFSFLLIGRASLDALNERLPSPLPMNRFRPNLVVDGSEPFAEDGWKRIAIGDLTFDVVKPCARCTMTTVDQVSGRFDGPEPLKTMAEFRRIRYPHSNEVFFGQNLVHRGAGVLRVGDAIEVLA